MRLDDLVAETGTQRALKVDVGGSDLDVLLGARGLAASPQAPIWLLEVNWRLAEALGYEPPDLAELSR